MEEIIIDTPLRTIVLAANQTRKHLSPLEEQSIEKYTELHQVIHNLAERFSAWYSEAQMQRAVLQALYHEVEILEAEQKRFGPIAGYEIDETGVHSVAQELDAGVFQKQVAAFGKRYNQFFSSFKAFIDRFEGLEDQYEQYELLFSDYEHNFFREIFKKWQSAELDICRLDDDYDEMKGENPVEAIRSKAIEECNSLPVEYQPIVPRIERIYRGVESIFANIRMWQEATNGIDEEKVRWN